MDKIQKIELTNIDLVTVKGDIGVQGPKGDKGDKGEQGLEGRQGKQGERGIKGDKGDIGPKGDKGAKGDQGEPGTPADETKIQRDIYTRISQNVGGGNMNRQIKVEGVNVLTKYTDINLYGTTSSVITSVDNVNKRVNIGFQGGANGVTSIAKQGDPALTGAVTISEGANISLTQVGQNIAIANTYSFTLTNGSGTTANGSTLDWVGTLTSDANIEAGSSFDIAFLNPKNRWAVGTGAYDPSGGIDRGFIGYKGGVDDGFGWMGDYGNRDSNAMVSVDARNRIIFIGSNTTNTEIRLFSSSTGGASVGYVWTLQDNSTGRGEWTVIPTVTDISGNAGTATALQNTRTLWGQNFNGTANVSGSLTAVGDITGGASSMIITAGTGNSRTLTLRSTTSGGTATAFITGNADQSTTFGGNLTGTGAWSLTGGAGNMTITSGTGNSRTMILRTTTSGGTATTALTLGADQSATFAAGGSFVSSVSIGIATAAKRLHVVAADDTNYGAARFHSNNQTQYADIGWSGVSFTNVGSYDAVGDGNIAHRWQVGGSDIIIIKPNGNFGLGIAYNLISARLHTVSTTEQLRVGYDTSNYFSTTVGSTGTVTFDAVGTGARFIFNDSIKIGGTALRATTEATNQLDIFDGTAPVGTLANGISLYSTSGELRVMDSAGNATLLSPHDKKDNAWIYDSVDINGHRLKIDVEKMLRKLNEKFGWDFVHELTQ